MIALALALRLAAPAHAETAQVASSTPTVQEAVDRLKKLDESLKSLKCGFEQTLKTDAGLVQHQSGKLYYLKPDHLRLEYDSPRRQITVSDRKNLWIYQVDDKQVLKTDWQEWIKGQSGLTGLLEFGQYSTLLEKHDASLKPVKAEGSNPPANGAPAWDLTLKPKKGGTYILDLGLSGKDFFPVRTDLALEGMKVTNVLKDVELNPDLKPDLFNFDPPKGVPVINLTNPLAP